MKLHCNLSHAAEVFTGMCSHRRPIDRTVPLLRVILAAFLATAVLAQSTSGQVAAKPAATGAAAAAKAAKPPRAAGVPKPSTPPDARGKAVLAAATKATGRRVLVSTEDRYLWLLNGKDTLMAVPVAVGMGKSFEYEGKSFFFETPRGRRTVNGKAANPVWNVPEWHYLERAVETGYGVVKLDKSTKYLLEDGSFILTIGENVGRLSAQGYFWPFDPGLEIMFDSLVFVPPVGTKQRQVPEALGPFKLDTGDGYLIHGTHIYNEDSIGEAVSHGCVRMRNEDLIALYPLVPVGTPVFIF